MGRPGPDHIDQAQLSYEGPTRIIRTTATEIETARLADRWCASSRVLDPGITGRTLPDMPRCWCLL